MAKLATREVIDDIKDIHRGVHVAMDNLITAKNYKEAEIVLRQIDARMTELINSTREVR